MGQCLYHLHVLHTYISIFFMISDISSYSPKYIKIPWSLVMLNVLMSADAPIAQRNLGGLNFHLQKRLRHHNMLGQLGVMVTWKPLLDIAV